MTMSEIELAIANMNRPNGAFYAIESLTTPKLTAKNRTTKEPTSIVVQIRSKFNCKLGVNYENCVNNSLERQGKDPTFEAQKPKGKHYLNGSRFFLADDATESKHYLAIDSINTTDRVYLINGREATAEEVEDLKANYLPKPSAPKEGVTWRTYSVDSIVAIH